MAKHAIRGAGEIAGSIVSLQQAAHLDLLLKSATQALECGRVLEALRYVDRAWRHTPDNVLIAQFLGRLLLRCGDYNTAARHLAELAAIQPSPDLEADIAETMLGTGAIGAAAERVGVALGRYAVAPATPLVQAARRVIAAQSGGIRGWVGIGPELDLIGEVWAVPRDARLELRDRDNGLICGVGLTPGADGAARFRLAAFAAPRQIPLSVLAASVPLIGSGLSYPPSFELDGRTMTEGGAIKGWARLGWRPDIDIEIMVEDGRGTRRRLTTTADQAMPYRRRFTLDLRGSELVGNEVAISAVLPDGSTKSLPDSPLLVKIECAAPPLRRRISEPGKAAPGRARGWRATDVVVPVYGSRGETLECLDALIATIGGKAELVVIDDASPDDALADALDRLAGDRSITLLRNERNRGFPFSANRGLALHPDRDVVLVNSDAVVHGTWLERLSAAAYSAPDIGTVTPFTNSGSIASYPGGMEQDCDAAEAEAIDTLAAVVNRAVTVELPVGVGFCQFFRRDCLSEVGLLDEQSFAAGYGEEVDFCLRATARGWRHVLAADVFVRHAGGRSFGGRRKALMERGTRIINLRYPAFPNLIEAFHGGNPASSARRRIDEARILRAPGRYVLLLTLALNGGVERFVQERCRLLREAGMHPLVLKPSEADQSQCILSTGEDEPNDLCYGIPEELKTVHELLTGLAIVEVEFHHFLDFDPQLVELVIGLQVPYQVYIHDYSWICPRLNLIDGSGVYCGEPEIAACETCVEINGSMLDPAITVAKLRRRSAAWLSRARRVLVPTEDVARRMRRHFPAALPEVIPWQPRLAVRTPPAPRSDLVRIAVIGAIGDHKGYRILLDCARDAAARNLALEFVVIGYTQDDHDLFATDKVFVTGRYQEAEVQDLLRRESPHVVFIPSVTPETWCYALSHALESGLPVLGFELGAIGERLRQCGKGTVIPLTADPVKLNQLLMEISREHWRNTPQPSRASPPVPRTELPLATVFQSEARSESMPSLPAIPTTVRLLPVSEGLYSFSIGDTTPIRTAELSNLLVPAVHVGIGPGTSGDLVQFIAGPRTEGAWLYGPGDMLVAKVSGPATILLTSLQGPNGQILAVDVERLDNRIAASHLKTPYQAVSHEDDEAKAAALSQALPAPALRVQVNMHIRNLGDTRFVDADWAGRSGRGKWIEAFSLVPLEQLAASDIEYKGLTATGLETPWISDGGDCGSKGKAMPLVGFAIRLRQNAKLSTYDCEYSGYFQSGTIIGPLQNGTPCRSSFPNDPLEGLKITIMPRSGASRNQPAVSQAPVIGPRFSKLREDDAAGIDPSRLPRNAEHESVKPPSSSKGKAVLDPADRIFDELPEPVLKTRQKAARTVVATAEIRPNYESSRPNSKTERK